MRSSRIFDQMNPEERGNSAEFVESCLLLDLETDQSNRILKIGAKLGARTFVRSGTFDQAQAVADLDRFGQGACCLVGHNLVRHDCRILQEANATLDLHSLPVIDTLFLSPICFPENPYHHLVKDYKLVSGSVNDPVDDARLSGLLLTDELNALRGMAEAAPGVFQCLKFLLAEDLDHRDCLVQGMQHVFRTGDADDAINADHGRELLKAALMPHACRSAVSFLAATDFDTQGARWSFAYAVTWLRVAGADSVLPPWVRMENPLVSALLARLRDVPCDAPECAYCCQIHNPERQLEQFFGFDAFRPTPEDADGRSLQRAIVQAGMRNESVLAILPTGGGKSLCFQLPALIRNCRRGQLTIVVSPLQALMKDQVDGLVRRTGMNNAAALYGLLTSPERGQVLRGVRTGRIGILYISPEQLRGRAFRNAVAQREIGCWVLDEAHCLSKWGHDFRPDYLYVGRFIRYLAKRQECSLPPVACFTATAKQDVIEEIVEFFRRETGSELTRYEGGVERDNLLFKVQTVGTHTKLPRIHDLLTTRLSKDANGSGVIFRATRRAAEETAEFLLDQGWSAAHFHAGLAATEKKRIQDDFLGGAIRVICATNAFGMGIDKDDVRIVIHGDTPGSLENYLQEAGRAGRDREPAECLLLYDEEDCEKQFRFGAFSQLTRRDIAQILRGLRKAARMCNSEEVVITTGELLRDEDVDTGFGSQDTGADTKVRAAVSWLERAGFVERNENRTNVIQARLQVKDEDEAKQLLNDPSLSQQESALCLAVALEMMNATETDMISVDEIAMLPEFQAYLEQSQADGSKWRVQESRSHEYLSAKVLKVLDTMMGVGVIKKDTLLTAYVRYKVSDHSIIRLEQVLATDRALVKLLSEEEPDPEGWLPLNLRLVNDTLAGRDVESSTEMLRRLIGSLSEDGRGFAGQTGSIESRYVGRDAYRVRIRREWSQVDDLAEKRRKVATLVLDAIIGQIPAGTAPKGDLLVEFCFETLQSALEQDLILRSDIRDMQAAIERALMFLHEQNVIILQKGLAIFRSAMTVAVLPEAKGQRYTNEHYDALKHHYQERVFQVHVMNEYARYGMKKMGEALELVVAYFTMDRESFIQRFFNDRRELLERATTARSYRAIVDSLGNRDQIRIVTQSASKNLLVLAGPGAGKTRTVVHRCAYLLRVKRVRARAILVCCFNHKAVLELRRRLHDLVGRDAIGVTVQTYHGLALRILGVSGQDLADRNGGKMDFDQLIERAIRVLRGEEQVPGIEPDDVRDRLLAGFEHILVDEYQDIDEPQYDMISAIAGRTLDDDDCKLSILAVGDDDQSIYGFRGANVAFIRRFQQDYKADATYLVENYRSTRYIIEAANRVIAANRDRMKTDHPISIDQGRSLFPAGGTFGDRDERTRGRVAVLEVRDAVVQARAVVDEILHLRALGVSQLSDIAVLSRTRRDLALVRGIAETEDIRVAWSLDRTKIPPLTRIRELRHVLRALEAGRSEVSRASELLARFCPPSDRGAQNPWHSLLQELLSAWAAETADEPTPVNSCIVYLYETMGQRRREEQFGEGVVLATIHGAKGMEYPHVILCGDWAGTTRGAATEEERRVFYVGMTRARETLTIVNRADHPIPFASELIGPCFSARRVTNPETAQVDMARDYTILGMDDIFLDFAGRRATRDPIHARLQALQPDDFLRLEDRDGRGALLTDDGVTVALLSKTASATWLGKLADVERVQVACMLTRSAEDCKDENFRRRLKVKAWEIPICELAVRQWPNRPA